MHSFVLIFAAVCFATGQPVEKCCSSKSVGGVQYSLVSEGAVPLSCISECIYQGSDDPTARFCFARGNLPVTCEGSEGGPTSEGGNEGGNGGVSPSEVGNGGGFPSEGGGSVTSAAPEGENEGGKCTYPEGHTMIKYQGPVAECGYDLTITGLDQATKDELLKTHNQKRQKVASGNEAGQPGASNMRKLTWNDELAEIAQRWAGQCSFGHDETRNLCDGTLVGQNAYQGEADYGQYDYELNPAIGDAVNAWYNEVTNPGFASSNINPFVFGDGWGHYTAVAWAETEQVGFGRVYFEDNDQWFKHIVVCNYAVAGNTIGGVMYETGDKCSNCPAGYSCDTTFDALCVKN